MRAFLSVKQMAEADLLTMRKEKISSFKLMDRVANDMVDAIRARHLGTKFHILCGPGNNGGDGYLVAEKLRTLDCDITVDDLFEPQSADCKEAARLCKAKRSKNFSEDTIIIDAVFGTGARSSIDKPLSNFFKSLHRKKNFKISLDCPSPQFHADLTLCVGFYKESFLEESSSELLGEIQLISQFFSEPASRSHRKIYGLNAADFYFSMQRRSSHKGFYGRCGIVAGSAATPGAAFLAGEAAYRVGAGYVTVYFADEKALKISIRDASFILKQKWKASDFENLSSMVLGCGGYSKKNRNINIPHVIDAEALLPFSKISPGSVARIFTPHPPEAAKLLKCRTDEVLSNKWESLAELTELTRSAVYLKGAPGILHFFDEPNSYYVNMSVNPAFSKAGSGDILAGIMGGFLAQAASQQIDFKSAIFSSLVFQKEVGEVLRSHRGLMVSDQLNVFSEAFKRLKDHR